MKHLKSIYDILEKQLKLFPNDNHPDNLNDIGMEYLKKRKAPYQKKGNITTWDDGIKFLEDNKKSTCLELVEYLETESIDIGDEEFIKNFGIYLINEGRLDDIFDTEELDTVKYWANGGLTEDGTDNIYVYRSMMLPYKIEDLENIDEKGVGIYWAYIPEGAESHGAMSYENEIILKAIVEPSDVNWEQTLHKSLWSLKDEKEIELLEGTSIEITQFKLNSNHPIVNKLYDKDMEYFKSIGFDSPYNLVKKKGEILVDFEEPIIVRT
jgi:hypothetical protein